MNLGSPWTHGGRLTRKSLWGSHFSEANLKEGTRNTGPPGMDLRIDRPQGICY